MKVGDGADPAYDPNEPLGATVPKHAGVRKSAIASPETRAAQGGQRSTAAEEPVEAAATGSRKIAVFDPNYPLGPSPINGLQHSEEIYSKHLRTEKNLLFYDANAQATDKRAAPVAPARKRAPPPATTPPAAKPPPPAAEHDCAGLEERVATARSVQGAAVDERMAALVQPALEQFMRDEIDAEEVTMCKAAAREQASAEANQAGALLDQTYGKYAAARASQEAAAAALTAAKSAQETADAAFTAAKVELEAALHALEA